MYQTTVQCMAKTCIYIVHVHVPNYSAMHGKALHIYSIVHVHAPNYSAMHGKALHIYSICTKLRTRSQLSLSDPEDYIKIQTVQKQLGKQTL